MKKFLIILIILLIPIGGYCASEWDKDIPLDDDAKVNWPTQSQANNEALDRVLANYREGMKLTYSSASTVIVGAGEVACSNSDGSVRYLRKNPSSTNVTFADIDTGAEANNTYYVYANCDADAETATFKISLSSTAPDSVTYYKRLGSFVNSAGSMTAIKNDNDTVIVGTGTVANGGTISLPSGFSQDECDWTVSLNELTATQDENATETFDGNVSVSSSRVATVTMDSGNGINAATGTANYMIVCHR